MKLVATCARGTEGAVRGELASLGMKHLRGSRGAVTFEGRMEAGMRACLWSRTAMRVLAPLASFPCPDAKALYDGVRTVDWTEWLNVKTTLAVDATGTAPGLHHTGFVALKVKDGIVDSLRDALGGRPDVDTRDPDVRIVLHLSRGQAELSLDLSGAPLYRRGWRNTVTEAPLKETLAASMLALGEVAADRPFLDPLCGSGTLPIEQALSARRIAPGLGRVFGFQRWPRYRGEWQSSWDRMKEEARGAILPAPRPPSAPATATRRRSTRPGGTRGRRGSRRTSRSCSPRPAPWSPSARAAPSAPTPPTGSGSAASPCNWPGSTGGSPRPSSASTGGASSCSPATRCWSEISECVPNGPTGSGTDRSR